MPKFSKQSLDKLSPCHEDLQKVMHEAIKHIDFIVLYGYRTPEEQFELYKKGRKLVDGKWVKVGTTVTNLDGKAKKSNHNYNPSRAVDIAPYPIDWGDEARFWLLRGLVMAASREEGVELEYLSGGRDLPHFNLSNSYRSF